MSKRVFVLDDIGFVELMDHMGSDLTVVNAARVSFDKQVDSFSDADARLIRYLAKHHHWTPFSHPQITFRIKMPIFVARQWFKHTVGFTRNEVSRRYVTSEPEFYIPRTWWRRSDNLKQGASDQAHEHSNHFNTTIAQLFGQAHGIYDALILQGVAPEQARMVLPVATYTEFIETGSLYAYARLYNLRTRVEEKSRPQGETMQYAQAIGNVLAELFPVSWECLTHVE